eukprot:TRINITY_DN1537_c0_g1_i3.p1 TRINITY_DN1537_c0_g1~~TRINITY_DN1537_c0_g1_i3.p1  ORF type:complete len:387 (-),score=71.10 TRINITY_DN1537_c0_g1_i3:373-1533(-)
MLMIMWFNFLLVIFCVCYFVVLIDCLDGNYVEGLFSQSVSEAAEKFDGVCKSQGGQLKEFEHPLKGPQKEDLFTSVCYLGDPNARNLLFTISGTHGVEGYPGSMAQRVLMQEFPLADTQIRSIHIHMVNPYGAAHILKENEQNADQQKNGNLMFELDIDNPIILEFIDSFDIKNFSNQKQIELAALKFFELVERYGQSGVEQGFEKGQGTREFGISFFGPNMSWSTQLEREIVAAEQGKVDNILFIDWHSGTGPYGEWTTIPSDQQSLAQFAKWIPNGFLQEETVYFGEQPLYEFVKELSGAKNITRCYWEVGSYPKMLQNQIDFIVNIYCHYFGDLESQLCQNTKKKVLEFFYPQGKEFKEMAYENLKTLLTELLDSYKKYLEEL